MVANSWQHASLGLEVVQVTEDQVRKARLIIESMMPSQAAHMDAVLLAGVAHALAIQEQQPPLHH